jgi:P27 family predicted phage terminase small subunit
MRFFAEPCGLAHKIWRVLKNEFSEGEPMGSRGPTQKPVALHISEGTFRADRHHGEQPRAPVAIPECPPELNAEARAEFERAGGLLRDAGLVARCDKGALAGYAVSYALVMECEREIAREGLTVTNAKGREVPNPLLAVARNAMNQMRGFAAELGMSPAARSRIRVNAPGEPVEGVAKRKR